MKTYELSLTTNYVSDWDFEMAIRELIQNGTDQESLEPFNRFHIEYENNCIRFVNDTSTLKINTLLLGRSGKTKDDNTVGQFGEGYKIAALVLNRLGKTFTIYNHGKDEIWTSRFVNSRKWHDKILVFDVNELPSNERNLVIEVGNVSEDEYESLKSTWLGFQSDVQAISTDYGDVLLDPEQENKIYVNGLFISSNAEFKYGYNFKPAYLKLERDRKSCDSWDARSLTAKMLEQAFNEGKVSACEVFEMIEDNADDINLIGYSSSRGVEDMYIDEFDKKHGGDGTLCVPVSSNSDYEKVEKLGGKPIFVPNQVCNLVYSTKNERISQLHNQYMENELDPKDKLENWLFIYEHLLPTNAIQSLKDIINELS